MIKGVEMVEELELEVGSDDLGLCWSCSLGIIDVGLGEVVSADHLMDISLLKDVHLF